MTRLVKPVDSAATGQEQPDPVPSTTLSPECKGTIAHDKVMQIVSKRGRSIFDCYRKELVHEPGLEANVGFELHVTLEGKVLMVRAESPQLSQELMQCMLDEFHTWKFPPPEGGDCAVVSIPFILDPAQHDPLTE